MLRILFYIVAVIFLVVLLVLGYIYRGSWLDPVQAATGLGFFTALPESQMAFVPPQTVALTRPGQRLRLDSRHHYAEGVGRVEVFVNGLPAVIGPSTPFPRPLGTVALEVRGDLVLTNTVRPRYPTDTLNVSTVWTGLVPGTYDLSLKTFDEAGNEVGEEIVQRIEVQ